MPKPVVCFYYCKYINLDIINHTFLHLQFIGIFLFSFTHASISQTVDTLRQTTDQMARIVYDLQTANSSYIKHSSSIRKVEHPKANGAIANFKFLRLPQIQFTTSRASDRLKLNGASSAVMQKTQASSSKDLQSVWVRGNADPFSKSTSPFQHFKSLGS